ncbi:MAG: hypothetical protein Pars93KO_19750 [Parasphingorhabdus sp.]
MAKYSPETKAAVMSALLQGQSVSSVAKEYNIPKGTVSGWKNKGVAKKATQKKEDEIGVLLVEYLTTNLKALKAQAEVFTDADWLKSQDNDYEFRQIIAFLHAKNDKIDFTDDDDKPLPVFDAEYLVRTENETSYDWDSIRRTALRGA